jgi:hypothetical protein
MYFNRFSFVTGMLLPFGNQLDRFGDTELVLSDCEIQGEVCQISGVVFEEDETPDKARCPMKRGHPNNSAFLATVNVISVSILEF